MIATPGPTLPKVCDWMLNKNYESHVPDLKLYTGIVFNFLHFVIELTLSVPSHFLFTHKISFNCI